MRQMHRPSINKETDSETILIWLRYETFGRESFSVGSIKIAEYDWKSVVKSIHSLMFIVEMKESLA